jgi:hypothetical protein
VVWLTSHPVSAASGASMICIETARDILYCALVRHAAASDSCIGKVHTFRQCKYTEVMIPLVQVALVLVQ